MKKEIIWCVLWPPRGETHGLEACAPTAAGKLNFVTWMSLTHSFKVFRGVIFRPIYSLQVSQNNTNSPRMRNSNHKLRFWVYSEDYEDKIFRHFNTNILRVNTASPPHTQKAGDPTSFQFSKGEGRPNNWACLGGIDPTWWQRKKRTSSLFLSPEEELSLGDLGRQNPLSLSCWGTGFFSLTSLDLSFVGCLGGRPSKSSPRLLELFVTAFLW